MRSLISIHFPAPKMEPESAHVVSAVSVHWLQSRFKFILLIKNGIDSKIMIHLLSGLKTSVGPVGV